MFELVEKQSLPTLEDINNKEARNLAKRLKGKSDKETLTNILEWEEKNIQPWIDRWYIFFLLYLLLIVSSCFLPISLSIKLMVFAIFTIFAFFDLTSTISYFLPLIAFIIALFTWIFSINFLVANRLLPIDHLILLSIIFGGTISLLIYLILKYRGIKSFQPEFKLGDTFKLSLSVDEILKYRLAICRDYAKLTATLLLNLYHNSDIYFILIPQHVATGIKLNNKIYVLDQRLPVLTLENWLSFWREKLKKKKLKANIFKIIYNKEKLKIKKIDYKRLGDIAIPKINLENFTNKLANMLNIKQFSRKNKPYLEIPLKNYALCYKSDEIIEFSLIRLIKNKLENEFCENINKISKIGIVQNKNDLILRVYIK
jgi:predicted transglutaminase-like protease